jgi:hypothetical protein
VKYNKKKGTVAFVTSVGAFSCYEDLSYLDLRLRETEILENAMESMGETDRTKDMDTRKSDRE